MKCTKCGNELRKLENKEGYYICDRCNLYFKTRSKSDDTASHNTGMGNRYSYVKDPHPGPSSHNTKWGYSYVKNPQLNNSKTIKHVTNMPPALESPPPENNCSMYVTSSNADKKATGTTNTDYSKYKNIRPVYIEGLDIYTVEAGKIILDKNRAHIGLIQRMFHIGFNRAEKIMVQLMEIGVVGTATETAPRQILMEPEQFEYMADHDLIRYTEPSKDIDFEVSFQAEIEDKTRIDFYNNKYDYMTGRDFEIYCADLLSKNGFIDVQLTPSTGDYGADILATQNMVKYAIQCKCYSSDVGVDAVYQVSGGMKYYDANIGVVLTNRHFTDQAIALAEKIKIVLWNREFLNNLIKNAQ